MSSFSQEDYPKIRLIDKDTVVLITPQQVDKMNETFLQLDMCKDINESLIEQDTLSKQVISACEDALQKADQEVETCQNVVEEKDLQIENLNVVVEKQEKKIKLLKKSRNLMTVSAGIVGVILTLLVVN